MAFLAVIVELNPVVELRSNSPSSAWALAFQFGLPALVGVLGVVLGNLIAGKQSFERQNSQQSADSDENDKERLHELKKSCYVPLIQRLHNSLGYIIRLATMKDDAVQKSPLPRLGESVAHLEVIAPLPIVRLANQLYDKMGVITLMNGGARVELVGLRTQVEVQKHIFNTSADLRENVWKNMNDAVVGGKNSGPEWDRMVRLDHDMGVDLREKSDAVDSAEDVVSQHMRNLHLRLHDEVEALHTTVAELVGAVRSDLGLPPNTDALKSIYGESFRLSRSAHEAFHKDVDARRMRLVKDFETRL